MHWPDVTLPQQQTDTILAHPMKATQPMRYLVLTSWIMLAPIAQANVFKCSKDGQVSYQQGPCDQGSVLQNTEVSNQNGLVGCYLPEKPTRIDEKYEVKSPPLNFNEGTKNYSRYKQYWGNSYKDSDKKKPMLMIRLNDPDWQPVPVKPAPAEALTKLNQKFQLHLLSGVIPTSGYSSYRSQGIFQGEDKQGKAFFFVAIEGTVGKAQKVPCSI